MKAYLPIVGGIFIIGLVFTGANCLSNVGKVESRSDSLLVPYSGSFEIPTGDELDVTVKQQTENAFVVKILNVSARDVYCAFLPSPEDGDVSYFPYVTERKDEKTGNYRVLDSGGHFAPGLHSIGPNRSISFVFSDPVNGRYRLRFQYVVDSRVVELLSSSKGPLSDERRKAVLDASRERTTPEMLILADAPIPR